MGSILNENAWEQNYQLLSKLDVVCENASYNLDYEILNEASGQSKEPGKVKMIAKTFAKAFTEFIKKALELIQGLIQDISIIIRGGDKAVLRKELKVPKNVANGVGMDMKGFKMIFNLYDSGDQQFMMNGQLDHQAGVVDNLVNELTDERSLVVLKVGTPIDLRKYYGLLRTLQKNVKDMDKPIESVAEVPAARKVLASYRTITMAYIRSIKNIIHSTGSPNRKTNAAVAERAKNNGATNESISYDPSMTSRQKAAAMLEAAAYILMEDGSGQDDVQKDSTDFEEFPELPEEKPVEDDKYDPSNVGGADETPELEEIKDLCNNDQEVIDLLTDDEGKSATENSDGTQNESAFNFQW